MFKYTFIVRRLIEFTPLLVTIARETKGKTAYVRLFFEYVLIIPPLYEFLVNSVADILRFVILFIISFIILHSFYEIFYIFNDTWTVRREDYPAIRDYIKNINLCVAITTRTLYFLAMNSLLIMVMGFSLLRIVIPTALLFPLILIHNLQRNTIKRIATYAPLRILRLLYIPLLLLDFAPFKIEVILIVLLPWLFNEIVGYYWYLLNKAGNKVPFVHTPAYLWFGSFLILQIPLVWPHITCLAGNLALTLLSLIKNLKAKSLSSK